MQRLYEALPRALLRHPPAPAVERAPLQALLVQLSAPLVGGVRHRVGPSKESPAAERARTESTLAAETGRLGLVRVVRPRPLERLLAFAS